MRTAPPLAAPLFRSDGQAAILAALLLTGETLGLTELAERTSVPRSSVYREVSRLVDAGLLNVETIGREWQVSPNPDSPLLEPVRQILTVAYGPVPLLRQHLQPIAGIDVAIIFGSFAARTAGVAGPAPNDIDLLVLGTPHPREIYTVCRELEPDVGRPVNATIMTHQEWDDAVARNAAFTADVLTKPTLPVIGDLDGSISSQ